MVTFKSEQALAYYDALLEKKDNAVAEAIAQFAEQRVNERLNDAKVVIEAEVIEEITNEVSQKYNAEIELLSKFIEIPVIEEIQDTIIEQDNDDPINQNEELV